MSENVVYRRINGRVVPIRSKKNDRNKKSGSQMVAEATVQSGGAAAASYYAGVKADRFLSDEVGKINKKISTMPRPKKPKPFTKKYPKVPDNWGNTPMGDLAKAQYKKDRKSFQDAFRRSSKEQSRYTKDFSNLKELRKARYRLSKARSMVKKNNLKFAFGAGALAFGMDLGFAALER